MCQTESLYLTGIESLIVTNNKYDKVVVIQESN